MTRLHALYVTVVVFLLLLGANAYAQAPSSLTTAIKKHNHIDDNESAPKYHYSLVDLNSDGQDDAVVLITDNQYCGSGGCTLNIYRGTKKGFKFVSGSTISKPPIRLLNDSSHGWKSIVVFSGGTGDVVLKFNGKKYPLNPSMQPKATEDQLKSSKMLIESYTH